MTRLKDEVVAVINIKALGRPEVPPPALFFSTPGDDTLCFFLYSSKYKNILLSQLPLQHTVQTSQPANRKTHRSPGGS